MPVEVTPKKRGRPATGKDPVTSIRLSPEMRAEIDAWSDRQPDRPKRSEAIRRFGGSSLEGDEGLMSARALAIAQAARRCDSPDAWITDRLTGPGSLRHPESPEEAQ